MTTDKVVKGLDDLVNKETLLRSKLASRTELN